MTPKTEQELAEAIASAKGALRITGGGTRDIGNPVVGETLRTSGLSGITLYEPGALTLVAQAGTPVAEIESALDSENQRLAFEPMDHRTLLGTNGTPTIGGVVSGNVSGPRRIAVGACRDHMLGVRFVDGLGTIAKNGGRVMKNVTGYDLVKLLTGAYGTLGVLSEVSLKVLPRPETTATLIVAGLDLAASVKAMSAALGSPYEVTGAATHGAQTCIRIEGFENSVAYRTGKLTNLLCTFGDVSVLNDADSTVLWGQIATVDALKDHKAVTRVSIAPSQAPEFARRLCETYAADIALDWGGGLMWVGMTTDSAATAQNADDALDYGTIHTVLQNMATQNGGHATLIKAPTDVRAAVSAFQPENETIAALTRGLRTKFDPRGILNPGLMG